MDAHQGGQLALELIDAPGELADATNEFARDARPRRFTKRSQAPRDSLKRSRSVEMAGGDRGLQLWAQIDKVPTKAVDNPRALGHEVLAVITQQADLQGLLVEEGGREPLNSLAQDGAGESPRKDMVGISWLTLSPPRDAHQLRRHAHDALARPEQRLLQAA
jgi:hypothetical protein